MIDAHAIAVDFPENCFSACSEILIPATVSPKFTPNSLIAFHGSDMIAERLYSARYTGDLPLCGRDRIAWLHSAYQRRHLNPALADETARRIGIGDASFIPRDRGCVGVRIRFHADFWFPTSTELLTYWGLDTHGPICADREECWRPRLLALGFRGNLVMIGDRPVTI